MIETIIEDDSIILETNLDQRGERGPIGKTPDIAIGKVDTLSPENNAYVEKEGTKENVILNFGIPKGENGDIGPVGPTGPSGVYVGSSEPQDSEVNVWIDPTVEPDNYVKENELDDKLNSMIESGELIGPQGPQGLPGKDGRDGVGITTITSGQPTIEEDKTITTVMVNKTDGSSESFSIEAQNGQNGSAGANGENGLTPEIGANGNWFLGGTDTGKPSRGEKGEPGESPDLSDYALKDEVDEAIAEIDVGGRNLVKNSKWVADKDLTLAEWGKLGSKVDVQNGETYTLTTYCNGKKIMNSYNGYAYIYAFNENNERIGSSDYMSNEAGIATKTVDNQDISYFIVYLGPANCVVGDEYKVKLEKGNKSTDWTPDPDDFDDYVNSSEPIQDLNEKLDNIIPKNEVTDEVISIDDAVDYKVFETVVEGSSEQMTTSGKNLLPNDLKSQTKNGLTITINDDKSITINGTATDYVNLAFVENFTLPKGVYKLSYHSKNLPTTGSIWTVSTDEKGVDRFGFSLGADYSDEFEEDTIFPKIGFAVNGGTVFNNTTFYPMIEKGTIVTEYEVFTGGQPSPNPDYPQKIETLSFNKITSCGKNLYYGNADKYSFSVNSSSWYDIAGNRGIQGTNLETKTIYKARVKKGETYTAMATVTGSNITNMSLIYDDETSVYALGIAWTDPYTFEAKKDGYVLFRFWINSPSIVEVSNVQLERGSTATSYEPYQGQDFAIDLKENEMVEIPNGVKDELVIDKEGNVNLIKKIGKFLLDGSIDFYPFIEGSGNSINNYGNVLFANYEILKEKPAVSPYNKYPTVISNYFKEIDGNIWIDDKIAIDVNNYQTILTVPQNLATTTEEFKEWLATHNTTVYYELKEPQTINLGKITNLATKEGTNTFFINGNISSKMKIKYALNPKKYIDKKIAEISSAIIREG